MSTLNINALWNGASRGKAYPTWILTTGTWNDSKVWVDNAKWID